MTLGSPRGVGPGCAYWAKSTRRSPPMSATMATLVALIAVLLLAVTALTYRLWKLRQGGTAAILRDIPAVGGHGWRHGVIRYRGGEAGFYRFSSPRLGPDRRLSRHGIEIVSRRGPRGGGVPLLHAAKP